VFLLTDGSYIRVTMYELNPMENARVRLDALLARRADRTEIEQRQKQRLQNLLEFVTRQSRFYKRHYEDVVRPITGLGDLPPVTKPMLMDNFDDVVTDTAVMRSEVDAFVADLGNVGHRFLGRYPVWMTSGTTGEPGIFLQDDRALTATDAVGDRWSIPAFLSPKTLERLLRNSMRAAELAVSGGHYAAASGIAMIREEHPFMRDRIRLFSPKQPLSELVTSLNEYQPVILIGYTSVIKELAREQRAGQLDIQPAFITPSGEPITDAEKQELRETFDCTVREIYGATEFYAIAVECAHGNLHANTDWVVLEPVDENYQLVDPGEPSDTVLLTNLANRIQPIVRYELGDSVTIYEGPCPCGSPFPVLEVEGRQGEILRFETDEGETVPVFPLALTSVVEEVPGVQRTQIVRTGPDTLSVRLDFDESTDARDVWEQVERDLQEFLQRRDIADVQVERGAVSPERDDRSGKFRHVWSEIE